MKTKLKKWKKLNSKKLISSKYITVYKDNVLLPDGRKHEYFLTDPKGKAVAVLALNSKEKIILTKEFRYPVGRVAYSAAMGAVDKGEQYLAAAKRELKEETGYTAKSWELLGRFYASPGRSGTIFNAYLAKELKKGKANPDEVEYIELEAFSPGQLEKMIKKGEIMDPYLISSIYLLTLKLKK